MTRSFHTLLWILFFMVTDAANAQQGFVKRSGHQFIRDGKPYYYIGANYWYGGLLVQGNRSAKGLVRLRKELDFLKANGVTNLRVLAAAEGSGLVNGVQRVQPALQQNKNVFNEDVLKGLDILLSEMGKRNMTAVLYLTNNWEWSGGLLQYLNWNGLLTDADMQKKMNWEEMKDIIHKFYNSEACQQDYLKQVGLLVNRTNTVTQKKYITDPAIMAWEVANEPRPMRTTANTAYTKFLARTTAFIKSIDANHLVTLGHEGYMATDGDTDLFKEVHADKNVDYITIHIWPKNWNWFRNETLARDLPIVKTKTKEYLDKHLPIAEALNKPFVIEEFGLPRNHHSFSISASTSVRDEYFEFIFTEWQNSRKNNGIIGGVNFWAFGGTARATPGQVFWKEGDDYMGDPPMEEQGLNTVFDSDVSTFALIRRFAGK